MSTLLRRRGVEAMRHSSSFAPSDLAGLALWLKADALSLSDGDPVASWTDASGAGVTPTQATAGNKPTWKASIVNSKPIVRFDGSDDRMTFPSNPLSGASAGTLLIVHKIDTDPPGGSVAACPVGKWGSSASEDHWPYTDGNIYSGWGSNARKTVGNPAATMVAFRIYAVVSASADFRFYIDGGSALFSTGTNTVGWAGTAPTLGMNSDFGNFFDGDIAEVIAYSSALSLTNLNLVANYLATKYGLTWATAT